MKELFPNKKKIGLKNYIYAQITVKLRLQVKNQD